MEVLANPIEFETTENGSIPAGAIVASFKNIGNKVGKVNGIELKIGEATNYTFIGKPYNAISYEANDTKFKIRYTL